MSVNNENLIWLDLEMTGLDPDTDTILEIATIVTDKDLNILEEGPVLAIHHSDEVLSNMDEWCVRTHGESGLTDRCHNSDVTMQQAMAATIAFMQGYVEKGHSPMCGNTIGQDRQFLRVHMPELHDFFHYRNVDVSTIKELMRRWQPEVLDGFTKKGAHLALEDIRESIEELRYYKHKVFNF